MAKDHLEIHLIYPVIKVNFSTTVFQNGTAVLKECEEVLDLKHLRRKDARDNLRKLLGEFVEYVEN